MTKTKQNLVNDPAQLNLFDAIRRDQEERTAQRPGRMCVSSRLQAAIKTAIKAAPKSREQIADCMTELAGCEVTASMINNWTAKIRLSNYKNEFRVTGAEQCPIHISIIL